MDKKRFADFVFLITGSFVLFTMVVIVTVNFFKDGRLFERPVIATVDATPSATAPNNTGEPETIVVQPGISKTQVYTRTYDLYKPPANTGGNVQATPQPLVDYGEAIPPGMGTEKDAASKPSSTGNDTIKEGAATPGGTIKPTGTSEGTPKPTGTPAGTLGNIPSGTPTGTSGSAPTGASSGAPPNSPAGTPGNTPLVGENILKTEKIKVEVINYSGVKGLAEEIRARLEASGYEVSAGNGASTKPVKTEIIERNDKKAGAEVRKIINAGVITKQVDPASRFDVTVVIGDDYPR